MAVVVVRIDALGPPREMIFVIIYVECSKLFLSLCSSTVKKRCREVPGEPIKVGNSHESRATCDHTENVQMPSGGSHTEG